MFMEDFILLSSTFKNQLSHFCSENFIERNLSWPRFKRLQLPNSHLNIIEITNFIKEGESLTKVRFCLAWLQASITNRNTPQCGIVFIDGFGFSLMRFTDFLCYLTDIGVITKEENMQLTKEWLDITCGTPFYK